MPFIQKNSKTKNSDKKKADKIYSKLLHYTIYGTMVIVLAVIVAVSTQTKPHDTRSKATRPHVSPMQLISENQSFDNHCYMTDDIHTRIWNGTLESNGSFTIDLRFCTNESTDNLAFVVTSQRNTPFSLSAVSPNGQIVYPPTTRELSQTLCVTPTQKEIEKGVWQVILTAWEDEIEASDISVVVAPHTSQEISSLCPN